MTEPGSEKWFYLRGTTVLDYLNRFDESDTHVSDYNIILLKHVFLFIFLTKSNFYIIGIILICLKI